MAKRLDIRKWVEVIASADGRTTIHDKDLLLYCTSQIVEGVNWQRDVSRRVCIIGHEFFYATNRDAGGNVSFKTNMQMGVNRWRGVFGLIDDAEIIERDAKG